MSTHQTLFAQATSLSALRAALFVELERDGPAGIDRITPADFQRSAAKRLTQLHEDLTKGRYRCMPLQRFYRKKKSGGRRPLGICTVRDRIVQRALSKVLSPLYDKRFLDCSHGYRKGRSPETALAQIEALQAAGYDWVYEADIEDCFGSVNPDILANEIDKVCDDIHMRKLVLRILNAGIFEQGVLYHEFLGLPQGSPISPLLANIYLHPFDQSLIDQGLALIRYADDFVILTKTEADAEAAGDFAEQQLKRRRLRISPDKTRICSLTEGISFLGFAIDSRGRRPHPKAPQAIQRRVENARNACKRREPQARVDILKQIIASWYAYFGRFGDFQPEHPETALAAAEVAAARGEQALCHKFASMLGGLSHALRPRMAALHQKARLPPPLPAPQVSLPLVLQGAPSTACVDENTGPGEATLPEANTSASAQKKPKHLRSSLSDKLSPLLAEIVALKHQLHQEPGQTELYQKLASAYEASGQHNLAAHVTEQHKLCLEGAQDKQAQPVACVKREEPTQLSVAAMDRYLSLFRGREGLMAQAIVQHDGRLTYQMLAEHLDRKTLRSHLGGDGIYALYPTNSNGESRVACVDVTVSREVVKAHIHDEKALALRLKDAERWCLQLSEALADLKLQVLLEDSGFKGRRVWFFLEVPWRIKRLRTFLRAFLRALPPLPDGLHLTLFPDRDHSQAHDPGHAVRLPLGYHPRTGKRSRFLHPQTATPLTAEAALLYIQPSHHSALEEWLAQKSHETGIDDLQERFPQASKLLDQCLVLRRIIEKLKVTRYLDSAESVSLLYSFGHLGEEGQHFLHAVFGLCLDYEPNHVNQRIERRRPFPISCPRLRDKHAELINHANCQCLFRKIPKEGYPTPLLHVVSHQQLFPRKEKAQKNKPEDQRAHQEKPKPAPPAKHPHRASGRMKEGHQEEPQPASPKHQPAKAPPKSLSQAKAEAEAPARSDTAPRKPVQHLNREPLPDDAQRSMSASKKKSKEPVEDSVSTPRELHVVLKQYMMLKRNLRGLERSIQLLSDELAEIFDEKQVDEFESDFGLLKKVTRSDGTIEWKLEL